MERKVTKLEHSHVEVLVTVDEKSWKDAQKKAFDKLAEKVTVAGFRKGKAPEELVKKQVNQMQVFDDAINSLLPKCYKEILDNEDVKPYAQPRVDVTKLSDTELEIKFTIVTAPELKLGSYKGHKIGKAEVSVSKEEVEAAMKGVVEQNASLITKEGKAELGDTVVIDFAGSVDGQPFDGGTASNYELELGSHRFIPGFEEQLVGAQAGEHVDVKVKFPENYTEELKGKDALFACDVHEVKAKKYPELNDELVKEQKIEGVETVDQLRTHQEKELKTRKEAEAKREYMSKLYDAIAAGSQADIPEEIVEQQVESRKKDMEQRMAQSGLNLKQYLDIIGQKEEEFMAKLKEDALRDLHIFLIMEEIAKVEKMDISDEELEFEYSKIADQYKMKIEDVKKALEPQKEEFRNNLKMQRVEELLYKEND